MFHEVKDVMYRILILLAVIFFMASMESCKSGGYKKDQAMADIGARDTAQVGDTSVPIEGCGNQPIVGYTYCRITANAVMPGSITVSVPPAQCREDNCVQWKLYRPDGQEHLGGLVPKGQTKVTIPWRQILGRESVTTGDRGFWPIKVWVRWVDEDGRDRESSAEGEVRLRVIQNNYQPLNNVSGDRNFVWIWNEGNTFYRMTTALRTYVGAQ